MAWDSKSVRRIDKNMTFHPAAFLVGEYALIESAETVRMLVDCYADHSMFFCEPNMDQHAGKLVRIAQNECPLPGVVYILEEVRLKEKDRLRIPGVWSEEALIDCGICLDSENAEPFGARASDIYIATSACVEGTGLVLVHDRDNRLFCSFRVNYAKHVAVSINRIAKLRCRMAFEKYFGFDGDYS